MTKEDFIKLLDSYVKAVETANKSTKFTDLRAVALLRRQIVELVNLDGPAEKEKETESVAENPNRKWEYRYRLEKGRPDCIGYGSQDTWVPWTPTNDAPKPGDISESRQYRYSDDDGKTWVMVYK